MTLIFIIGEPAKVLASELKKITKLPHFHNTFSAEPFGNFYGEFQNHNNQILQDVLYEEFAIYNANGLIFSNAGTGDRKIDWSVIEYIESLVSIYDINFYYVEIIKNQPKIFETTKNFDDYLMDFEDFTDFSSIKFKSINLRYPLEECSDDIFTDKYIRISDNNIDSKILAEKINKLFNLT